MTDSNIRISDLLKEMKASVRSLNSTTRSLSSTKSNYTSRLHKLCDASSYAQIRDILPTVPRSIFLERQGLHKWTPIMMSCMRAPLDIIKIMIHYSPESCYVVDTSKSLPLHFVACWRRDGEEARVVKALIQGASKEKKEQIEVTNQWGQNPIHAAFDSKEPPSVAVLKVLLGRDEIEVEEDASLSRLQKIVADDQSDVISQKSRASDDRSVRSRTFSETKEENKQDHFDAHSVRKSATSNSSPNKKKKWKKSILTALSTLDSKSRLPLHIACKNGASYEILQLLVALYPEACSTPTQQNELPMHLYFEYLNTPLGKRKSDMAQFKNRASMELLIKPLIPTYKDAKKRKRTRGLLPLHIACELGLNSELITQLCHAYPKGVSKVKPGTTKYPLELFLLSKAHDEAISAKYKLDNLSQAQRSNPSNKHLHSLIEKFHQTSDLLFAYDPEAIPSEKSGIKLFRRDVTRITRLEKLIRQEALDKNVHELSTTARLVWTWMCHFTNPENSRDVYVSSVGRVIDNLDSSSLWKLTFVKNAVNQQKTFLKIGGNSGRTVVKEAERRALRTTFYDLLQVSHVWQNKMIRYLNAKDALSYSCVCKHTYVTGVKYLSTVEHIEDGRWECTLLGAHPEPWKKLNLIVPTCTHSIELSYRLSEFETSYDEQIQNAQNGTPTNRKKKNNWKTSGLKVLKGANNNDFRKKSVPSVDSLVQCKESRSRINDTETDVKLEFNCDLFQSYELWYFLPITTSFISVKNLVVKHLLYCRNTQKRTPIFTYLSLPEVNQQTLRKGVNVSEKITAIYNTSFPPYHMSPFYMSPSSTKINNMDSCILHYGLNCNASLDVLQTIISLNPSALVEIDEEGRTPLHTALIHTAKDSSLMVVKSLILTTPGENACRFKDLSGQLPLHIAAEHGASEEILQLLVHSYADGCYRQNGDGDLPLHLLERSGKANAVSLELLIRPIMGNESICRVEGSRGCDLPLHIAARHQCSLEILEKLLRTYGDAAVRDCKRNGYEDTSALSMFEQGRKEMFFNADRVESDAAKNKIIDDFNQRSDLLFVYNPMLNPDSGTDDENGLVLAVDSQSTKSGMSGLPIDAHPQDSPAIPYRRDELRISRLAKLIIKEAERISEGSFKSKSSICDTARLAWFWLITFESEEGEEDYSKTIDGILNKLSSPALKVLAFLEWNGKLIKDSAIPKYKLMMINRIRFVGRYEWNEPELPLHKSDTCLILRARDHYAVEEYSKMKKILEDNATAALEEGATDVSGGADFGIPLQLFLNFCQTLGLSEREAKRELRKKENIYGDDNFLIESADNREIFGLGSIQEGNEEQQEDEELEEFYMESELKVNAVTFESFCKSNGLDDKGVRTVVIKFMLYKKQFEREKRIREIIRLGGSNWPVVPILEEYNADRMEFSAKDALYVKDIRDKDESTHDMFRYKYALVLMGADRDLVEISTHESPDILHIREYMNQVGMALQMLHRHAVIHGDLRMANVVRVNSQLALIDLDSSYSQSERQGSDSNLFGGSSHAFSSGMVPPEFITKIELPAQQILLDRYEFYWKSVSEDSRDIELLTPDDICNITSVLKNLAMTGGANFFMKSSKNGSNLRTQPDASQASSTAKPPSSSNIMPSIPADITLDDAQEWKNMISMALITISFNDLPYSLTSCQSISEFSNVWNKLLLNSKLWNQVKPRTDPNGDVYVVKAFHQTDDNETKNSSLLPFNLIAASEKFDIWAFGLLIFAMCAKGPLFPLDHNENLVGTDSYIKLYEWDKKAAQAIIEERVDDPLAKDLLQQILVPEHERLESMSMVLSHPFFGSSTGLEAQRILEKHEEQLLMLEETCVITKLTSETLMRLEYSTENQCKLIFEEDKIVVPTSLVILPYQLEVDENGTLHVPNDRKIIDLALRVGKHLLDINMTTARLSFWLKMKKSNGNSSFKLKMKDWLKRARNESIYEVADEICIEIGCGKEYGSVCREMLQKGDAITSARAYVKDPMSTARAALNKSIEGLVQCYSSDSQYLYLVDEFCGVLAAPDDPKKSLHHDEAIADSGPVYPITIDPDTKHFQNFFLPFLNITMMNVTAIDGLSSLSRLLGLSRSHGIPDSWIDASDGLIHKASIPTSVVEFAVLQDLVRKQNFHTPLPGNLSSFRSMDSVRTGFSEWEETMIEGSEMLQLEIFFRDYDPLRMFSGLRRLTGQQRNGLAIWTTEDVIRKILEEMELARVEMQVKELKDKYYKSHGLMDEIVVLNKKLHKLQSDRSLRNDNENDSTSEESDNTSPSLKRKKMRNTISAYTGCGGFCLPLRSKDNAS